MAEADSLLTVSAGASHDRMRDASAARAMLHTLHTETSIFNSNEPPPERYLFILVWEENVFIPNQGRQKNLKKKNIVQVEANPKWLPL